MQGVWECTENGSVLSVRVYVLCIGCGSVGVCRGCVLSVGVYGVWDYYMGVGLLYECMRCVSVECVGV